MKLVIGLGNPGVTYVDTRHNTGFQFVDQLLKNKQPQNVVIKKSDTFMNESGNFVKKLVNQYKLNLSDLYIIHDDLDIKLGEYKIQLGHSPKDHNGLKSIDDALGTDEYWHVKIGIENRIMNNESRIRGEDYVLQEFTEEEKQILGDTIKQACKKLETLLANTK
jgi:PTH1 family peptidyl-tRNA hydrolase